MGIAYNTSLVTNGLIVYVDAANPRSYSGTGNTWYDLSGNNNHMTLVNGVAYSTNNGGVMQTDGTNDYIVLSPFDQRFTDHTIMGASRYSGATRGRVITSFTNQWLLGHFSDKMPVYYPGQWTVPQIGTGTTEWLILTALENYSADFWTYYCNGVLGNNQTPALGTQGPNGLCLGAYAGTSQFSTAEISFLMVYNRLLSENEIKQNYNAIKKRYGI